ncbi:MAG: hypothetical protein NVS3B3_21250 [Aquirhabdus sp.]
MLSERLKAYSGNRIDSINKILNPELKLDLHRLVAYMAMGSPRDMIRVCSSIIDEQTRVATSFEFIDEASIWSGIRKFAAERAEELYGDLAQLKRIAGVTVTISRLASEVMRATEQAARAKIQNWLNTGAVQKIGEIPNPPNRPLYLYGITDLRLAIAVLTKFEVGLVLANYALLCPECSALCISDEKSTICIGCSATFNLDKAQSLIELCTKKS